MPTTPTTPTTPATAGLEAASSELRPARRSRIARAVLAACLAALALAPAGCGDDEVSPPPARTTMAYGPDGAPSAPLPRRPTPRNVLLICLDTLRADALPPWGGPPDRMPGLARFLRTGVTFRQAASASPWTAPSIASLLCGLLPSRHGATVFSDDLRVANAVPTLAEILGRSGWLPGAFTGGGWVSTETGLLQGFLVQPGSVFSFAEGSGGLLAQHAVPDLPTPWFLFLHTYEAHDPYLAPPARTNAEPLPEPPGLDLAAIDRESAADAGPLVRRFLLDPASRLPVFEREGGRTRMERVMRYLEEGFRRDPRGPALAADAKAAYDRGVTRLDAALAGYLEAADSAGFLRDAIVVIASDHGEGFGEHGTIHHGRHLHDELIHVPLFVRAPGWPKDKIVDEPCSLLDVVPTILRLVDLPEPAGIDGRDLSPLVHGPGDARGRPIHSEERRTASSTGLDVDEDMASVRDAHWKLIVVRDRKTGVVREEVYDLSKDPGETSPLPPPDPASWSPSFLSAARDLRARFRR